MVGFIWTRDIRSLLHGAALHLERGTGPDLVNGIILIDSTVQNMFVTFLQLPKEVSKISPISEKDIEKASNNFHSIVGLFRSVAPLDLGDDVFNEIKWLHGLRNTLKRHANGLSIDRYFVERYLELAAWIFEALFCERFVSQTPEPGFRLAGHSPTPARRHASSEVTELKIFADAREAFLLLVRRVLSVAQAEGYRGNDFFSALKYLSKSGRVSYESLDHLTDVWVLMNALRTGTAPDPVSAARAIVEASSCAMDAICVVRTAAVSGVRAS